jgi:hypothetical protein
LDFRLPSEHHGQEPQGKFHFAEMHRLKFANFHFNRNKAVQLAVEEKQVNEEVAIANLNAVFAIDKGEVLAKF